MHISMCTLCQYFICIILKLTEILTKLTKDPFGMVTDTSYVTVSLCLELLGVSANIAHQLHFCEFCLVEV